MRLYDSSRIDKNNMLFSDRAIWLLLIPVIMEQILNSFMGMADTMMVSNVGSEAISAVSLVDAFNFLIIQVFAAMGAGATILCSQYIGRGDHKMGNRAAKQVIFTVTVISVFLTVVCLIACKPLLVLMFGQIEDAVMDACITYFLITVLSFPFIALFNAGSAFYRAGGNSKFPMMVSIISNVLNIGGNAVLIFGFHMGVAGAAYATLASRMFCAVVILYYLRRPNQVIVLDDYFSIRPDMSMILRILAIAIPAGIENGMFQFGKLAIQSSISTLGTTAIAANAMEIILENLNGVGAMAMGIGLMTLVGQCVGAGRMEEAKYYIIKVSLWAEYVMIFSCVLFLILTRPIAALANLTPECTDMVFQMNLFISIIKPLFWVLSFDLAYGMRAAGDVKFSMIVSTITMWSVRVAVSVFLIRVVGMGPIAAWIGMGCDWFVRAVIFPIRFISGKWTTQKVI